MTYEDLLAYEGRNKIGYQEMIFCAQQTRYGDLNHFWVDTYCIDRSCSAELSEASTKAHTQSGHDDVRQELGLRGSAVRKPMAGRGGWLLSHA